MLLNTSVVTQNEKNKGYAYTRDMIAVIIGKKILFTQSVYFSRLRVCVSLSKYKVKPLSNAKCVE